MVGDDESGRAGDDAQLERGQRASATAVARVRLGQRAEQARVLSVAARDSQARIGRAGREPVVRGGTMYISAALSADDSSRVHQFRLVRTLNRCTSARPSR